VAPTHALHLLRHAKSSWDDRSVRDHARPLAPRGQSAVVVMGRHLAERGIRVDLVLCSTAQRARETWDGVRPGVAGEPEVRFLDEIYEADPDSLLALLRGLDETTGTALLVGHNPGIADLASGLIGNVESRAAERMYDKYPTAALASFAVPGPWGELGYGRANLDGFVRPRDLPPA
jgi:phosphohistidine phosphatase